MPAGRNDPCPCGSGLKYKKCHQAQEQAAQRVEEPHRSLLHDFDHRVVQRVLGFAAEHFGEELDDAFEELNLVDDAMEAMPFLAPWLAFHRPFKGRPAVEWYAEAEGASLSRKEAEWIEVQRAAWLSVWEVREVVPGKSMILADLLTGEQRLVQEALASRTLVVHDAVLGRIVDFHDQSLLAGMYPRPLRPVMAANVIDEVRRELKVKLPLPVERLRDATLSYLIIDKYQQAFFETMERMRRGPKLRTPEGDPICSVVDHYAFESGDRAAVVDALTSLRSIDAQENSDGSLSIAFLKGSSLTGAATVTERDLRVETISRSRAASIRKRIERVCGDLLHSHRRTEEDPRHSMQLDDDEDVAVEEPADEEMKALVAEILAKHYETWIDEPLPALAGKTPRQAVRSKAGRAEVSALLKQFENMDARYPQGYDFNILRKKLGLDD